MRQKMMEKFEELFGGGGDIRAYFAPEKRTRELLYRENLYTPAGLA